MRQALLLAALFAAAPAAAADVSRGEQLWQQQCSGCHGLDAAKVGPPHRGVVGRVSGSVPGFAYSPALKADGQVWTTQRLDIWLKDPAGLVPGTRMRIRVPAGPDRADIIAFLQGLG
jgi:cytochrome c